MKPIRISAHGAVITTGASAAAAAIPNRADGSPPFRLRLAATAACYARLGRNSEISAVIAAAGTAYVPGDTITLTGGTETANIVLAVATTKVVSATVDAAGTGGTPGTATVTGTTGTGTKFQATVTISGGGAISSVDAIAVAGSYSANPTSIAHEPVTGGGLTGARLAVVMGVSTVTLVDPGDYSADPANPVSQGATSGSGVNATFTLTVATAASAGDMLVTPNQAAIVDASGFHHVSAIQVSGAGVLQISPLDD
jgi:hypothetical protein